MACNAAEVIGDDYLVVTFVGEVESWKMESIRVWGKGAIVVEPCENRGWGGRCGNLKVH